MALSHNPIPKVLHSIIAVIIFLRKKDSIKYCVSRKNKS
jgi:hypothetical protein